MNVSVFNRQRLREFVRGLQFRLICLVLFTMAPVLGLLYYGAEQHRKNDVASLERQCGQIVQLAMREEEEVVNGAGQILEALSQLPQVQHGGRTACEAMFAELLGHSPRYSDWGLVRTDGDVVCTARPLAGQISVADRSYFQDAMRTRAFVVGDWMEMRYLAWLGFIGGMVLGVAWIVSDLLYVRRVKALVSSTEKLAAGDLAVRAKKLPGVSELDRLADAFNRMAETLERHEAERQRAEDALRQSEEKYRRIVETANEGIWVMDRDFRITFANQRIANLLGHEVKDLFGGRPQAFLFGDDLPDHARRMENRRRGLSEQYERRCRRKDGGTMWLLVSATPLQDDQRCFTGSVAMLANITDRKQAEDALREFSGQLLRVQDQERRRIALDLHDNTAQWLAAISMNLTALNSAPTLSDERAKGLLSESQKLLGQCSQEVRTLSYLLHPPVLDAIGLMGAVEEYADEYAHRSGVRVQVELPQDLGGLSKDVEMVLFRVLQESLINVHRHSGSPSATVRLSKDAGEIRLEVIDVGHGMLECAEPGPPGPGPRRLGVGIAGMRERLRQFGGRLEIEFSRQGTTVRAVVSV